MHGIIALVSGRSEPKQDLTAWRSAETTVCAGCDHPFVTRTVAHRLERFVLRRLDDPAGSSCGATTDGDFDRDWWGFPPCTCVDPRHR